MRRNAHHITGPTACTKSRMTLACTSRLLHTRPLSSRSLQSVPAPLLASLLATSACYALIISHPPVRLSAYPDMSCPPSGLTTIHLSPSRRFSNSDQTFTTWVKLLVHFYDLCIVLVVINSIYQKIFKQKLPSKTEHR